MRASAGFTVTELVFAAALAATLAGLALPVFDHAVDDLRTASAARYVAGRIQSARIEAVKRGAAVAIRFQPALGDYTFTDVVDGNGNGVRTADIAAGIDRESGAPDRLGLKFGGVRFGLSSGVPEADGSATTNTDGVRIGSARILTLSPDGTATSGTLYIRGRRAQYAVRVLGVTARTRVLAYEWGPGRWTAR